MYRGENFQDFSYLLCFDENTTDSLSGKHCYEKNICDHMAS